MNYLSKPITGLSNKTSQLFLGRVITLMGCSSGLDVFQIPAQQQALTLAEILNNHFHIGQAN
jgi:uncharacterized protein (UPF0210 family)